MRTSNRSLFHPWSKRVSATSRTAVYGPVRTVVWEGWSREAPPYPDLCRFADFSGAPMVHKSNRYSVLLCNARLMSRMLRQTDSSMVRKMSAPVAVLIAILVTLAAGLAAQVGKGVPNYASEQNDNLAQTDENSSDDKFEHKRNFN